MFCSGLGGYMEGWEIFGNQLSEVFQNFTASNDELLQQKIMETDVKVFQEVIGRFTNLIQKLRFWEKNPSKIPSQNFNNLVSQNVTLKEIAANSTKRTIHATASGALGVVGAWIGGTTGATVGSVAGPIGTAVGATHGAALGASSGMKLGKVASNYIVGEVNNEPLPETQWSSNLKKVDKTVDSFTKMISQNKGKLIAYALVSIVAFGWVSSESAMNDQVFKELKKYKNHSKINKLVQVDRSTPLTAEQDIMYFHSKRKAKSNRKIKSKSKSKSRSKSRSRSKSKSRSRSKSKSRSRSKSRSKSRSISKTK